MFLLNSKPYSYQNPFNTININFPNQIYKFDLYVLFRCFEPEIYSTYFQDLTMSFSLRNEETTFTKPQYMIKFVQLPCRYFCVRLHLWTQKNKYIMVKIDKYIKNGMHTNVPKLCFVSMKKYGLLWFTLHLFWWITSFISSNTHLSE